jgi:hypothetical protein
LTAISALPVVHLEDHLPEQFEALRGFDGGPERRVEGPFGFAS